MMGKVVKADKAAGLKQSELMHCVCCKKGVCNNNQIMFHRLTFSIHIINCPAVQRQYGFEMMMGGPLAAVMGPDEDMTIAEEQLTVHVCMICAAQYSLDLIRGQAVEACDEQRKVEVVDGQ